MLALARDAMLNKFKLSRGQQRMDDGDQARAPRLDWLSQVLACGMTVGLDMMMVCLSNNLNHGNSSYHQLCSLKQAKAQFQFPGLASFRHLLC